MIDVEALAAERDAALRALAETRAKVKILQRRVNTLVGHLEETVDEAERIASDLWNAATGGADEP